MTEIKMKDYQENFIQLAESVQALSFCEFELKSGRISPYFFNAGRFSTGKSLWKMAECYADKIIDSNIKFDLIFGPAYKGIPLVAAVSVILSQKTNKDIPWAFNRKEKKEHGEGGNIVGSQMKGRVLIIDDVITAGTAIRETIKLLSSDNIIISDILVALDRQETYPGSVNSAVKSIESEFSIKSHSIIGLDDLITYAQNNLTKDNMEKLTMYREKYGVNT